MYGAASVGRNIVSRTSGLLQSDSRSMDSAKQRPTLAQEANLVHIHFS